MSRLTLIFIALLLVCGVTYAVWSSYLQGVPVDVAVARMGRIRTYVEERAKTRLPVVYRITMPLDGRILPIDLKERDAVTAGKVVARLEAADFDTAVAEGAARLQRLQNMIVENQDNRLENNAIRGFDEFLKSMAAAVESARLQTTSSDERFKYAEREFKRKTRLFEQKAISESERNEGELFAIESQIDFQKDLLTWRALQAVESAMKIGQQSISDYIDKKSLHTDVLQQEQREAEAQQQQLVRDLRRAELHSPVDGIVLKRYVSNERVLTAGEPLLEIGRLEDLEVEAEVLTQDVVEVHNGDPVDIEGPAIGPRPLRGTVARIYPQGFTKVSSLGVEQQRVLVIIHFDPGELQELRDSARTLGVDYRVRVKIYTDHRENTLTVPRSALFRGEDGGWETFVVRQDVARRVKLNTGLGNDYEVEVLEGIADGDQVILAPELSLSDGQRVDPTQQ